MHTVKIINILLSSCTKLSKVYNFTFFSFSAHFNTAYFFFTKLKCVQLFMLQYDCLYVFVTMFFVLIFVSRFIFLWFTCKYINIIGIVYSVCIGSGILPKCKQKNIKYIISILYMKIVIFIMSSLLITVQN